MQRTKLLAVLVLTLMATGASAEIYKWVDEDAKVHYGDRKPAAGSEARALQLPPTPSKDADHADRSLQRRRLLDAFEAERAEKEQAAEEAATAKQERNQRCARIRRDLARFERANIVYNHDDSGARVYMSDEERREAVADARTWIDNHCD